MVFKSSVTVGRDSISEFWTLAREPLDWTLADVKVGLNNVDC